MQVIELVHRESLSLSPITNVTHFILVSPRIRGVASYWLRLWCSVCENIGERFQLSVDA